MLNLRTLAYGLLFGLIDSVSLPIIKGVSIGWNKWLMLVPIIMYAISPLIFLKGLSGETLTILNLVWDLTSDIIVTIIGLFFFAEHITPIKGIGVGLSFISLFLMSYENDDLCKYLEQLRIHIIGC